MNLGQLLQYIDVERQDVDEDDRRYTREENILKLNRAQEEVLWKTGCIKKTETIVLVTGAAASGTALYNLESDTAWIEWIERDDDGGEVKQRDEEWMRSQYGDDWKSSDNTGDTPLYYVDARGNTTKQIRIFPFPSDDATGDTLTVYGVKYPEDLADSDDEPEFERRWHIILAYWVLWKGFLKDAEGDMVRAALAKAGVWEREYREMLSDMRIDNRMGIAESENQLPWRSWGK